MALWKPDICQQAEVSWVIYLQNAPLYRGIQVGKCSLHTTWHQWHDTSTCCWVPDSAWGSGPRWLSLLSPVRPFASWESTCIVSPHLNLYFVVISRLWAPFSASWTTSTLFLWRFLDPLPGDQSRPTFLRSLTKISPTDPKKMTDSDRMATPHNSLSSCPQWQQPRYVQPDGQ